MVPPPADKWGYEELVERLRDAVTRYQVSDDWSVVSNTTYVAGQVSRQQAIYDQSTNLSVSLVLRLVFSLCVETISDIGRRFQDTSRSFGPSSRTLLICLI